MADVLHALEAVRVISCNLYNSVQDKNNTAAREAMMYASMQAGMAFSNASLGVVHAMAHSMGGYLDLPHGECNAILLTGVVAFNYPACPERFDRIAEAMGIPLNGLDSQAKADRLVEDFPHFQLAQLVHGDLFSCADASHQSIW